MMVFGPLAMLVGVGVLLVAVVVGLRFVLGAAGPSVRRSCGPARPAPRVDVPVDEPDPLEIVRARYARGDIDHDELERYLDNLLASERPRDRRRDAGR